MNALIIFILVLLFVIIFDKSCLWLEKKGYLYYRHKKPTKGIVGASLQELNAQFLPSHRHIVIAKEQKGGCKQNQKDILEKDKD